MMQEKHKRMEKKKVDRDVVDVEETTENERNRKRSEKNKKRTDEVNDRKKVEAGNEKAYYNQAPAAKMSSVKAGSVAGDRVKSASRKGSALPPPPATYSSPPAKGRQVILSDNANEYAEILDAEKACSKV